MKAGVRGPSLRRIACDVFDEIISRSSSAMCSSVLIRERDPGTQ